MDFVVGNSNKLQGFEGKINWTSMCSHCQIYKFSILKMWKIKNVFTLGPMTQAILITMRKGFHKVRQR
jgi:hypothetical protein